MPRNPSGVYTIPNTFVDGTVINTDQVNANFADIATALTGSLPRDGSAAMNAPLRLANGVEALPSLSFASDPDTGFYWKASGEVGFASNGEEIITFSENGVAFQSPESILRVGDFFETTRELGETFLRRNGALYDVVDHPDLAAQMPELPDGVIWSSNEVSGTFLAIEEFDGALYGLTALGVVQRSTDGVVWSVIYTFDTESMYPTAITASNSFLMVSFSSSDGSDTAYYSTSADGENWSAPSEMTDILALDALAYGNGLVVGVGRGGSIITTPDGATITEQTSGVTDALYGVHFTGSMWIVVGASGTILTAPPAADAWTERTSGVSSRLNGVNSYDGLFLVVGNDGAILTSTTGVAWSPRASGTSSALKSVTGNAEGFIAVGDSGTSRISPDAFSWTTSVTGSSASLRNVIVDPNNDRRYLVSGTGNVVLDGLRTDATLFRVPNDDPEYGWIKAL